MTSPLDTDFDTLLHRLAAALARIDAASTAQAAETARLHRIESAARDTLAGLDALLAGAPADAA
ncbi:MAG: hypothetical protein WCO82_01755 [Sphingomonadales bacterium]|jgi:hypothetical protein